MDDGLIAGSSAEICQEFLSVLRREFQITVGDLTSYLGIRVSQLSDGSIRISQEKYVERILEKFRMDQCNPLRCPAGREEESSSESVKDKVPYREAVGCLIYLATATRPDIAFAVHKAARAMENPTRSDWNAVVKILKYLKGTASFGITYSAGNELNVYSDADFAGDISTRRSTNGFVAMYGGGAISWKSQLQKSVALSTTEAEIVAASEATKELIWLSRLLRELFDKNLKATLFVDNASAVKLAKNPEFHKRSKHIEVRHFFVREKYVEGSFDLQHIEGKHQLADLFTKALDRNRFESLRNQIGLRANGLEEVLKKNH